MTLCASDRAHAPLLASGVPERLLASVRHYHAAGRWHCQLILLMPDHLHAVLSFPATEVMTSVVTQWKGFNRRRVAVKWQRGFFDHRLRSPSERELKLAYIRQNPVRAGLVAAPEDWPWQWPPEKAEIPS